MNVLLKRPALRWIAPALVVLTVATAGLVGTRASADTTLPDISAQDLLVKVAESEPAGLSGTVEQSANLGLPSFGDSQHSSDFSSLISGTHTLRVAYASPDKARIAVHGELGESDLISNGTEQWLWSSDENTVVHRTGSAATDHTAPDAESLSPTQAAADALAAVDDSTDVTLAKNVTVADRPSYELVLTPKASQSGTTIASVRLAVDGETFVPLRVQVYANGLADPAFSTAFTSIDYTVPAASEFTFTPPSGAKVTEKSGDEHANRPDHTTGGTGKYTGPDVKQVGSGWTTVVVAKVPSDAAAGASGQGGQQLDQVLGSLPKVSGAWGSGRLLQGTAFSAVLTDDGRLAVGAVTPDLLYAALR